MISNNRGITLVEVLAALALIGLLMLLVNSVQIFGQKQVIDQKSDIENQSNVNFALHTITKEMRNAESVEVEYDDNNKSILTINISDSKTNKFNLENDILKKNDQPFISNIGRFDVVKNESKITLQIESKSRNSEKPIALSTTIYLRE